MSQPDLAEHLRAHALVVGQPIRLRSGAVSDWYVDARRTTLDGAGATLVAEAILDVLDGSVTAIGGMTMGADPIAVATVVVAHRRGHSMRAFSVRSAPKDHGMGGRLVGPVAPGERVAIVEDTTTTGSAMGEAIGVAEEAGLEVVQVIAVVDRSGGRVGDAMAARGLPYLALVDAVDLGMER